MSMKYIIENDIHFYEELKKSSTFSYTENRCLISNQELISDQTVIMECGHKFNYVPLFLDLVNHKKKFNSMENTILKTMELRCPYCRHVQKNLLQFIDLPGVEKVHGVNFLDDTMWIQPENKFKGKCAYHTLLQQSSGVWETVSCVNEYVTHVDILGKDYCSFHKYKAIQDHIKYKKEEEKAKKKEEEKKKKEEIKKQKLTPCCKELIKTGKNKGKECGCKIFTNEGVCKRHYSVKEKDNPVQKI